VAGHIVDGPVTTEQSMPKAIFNGAVIAEKTVWVYRIPKPESVEIGYRAAFYPVVTIER
jgi:uncharacterized protein (DUF427 family)